MALSRQNHIITITAACLHRLPLLCAARHGPIPTTDQTLANNNTPKAFNARLFIAAYMIVHYPRSIFETIEDPQQPVIDRVPTVQLLGGALHLEPDHLKIVQFAVGQGHEPGRLGKLAPCYHAHCQYEL